MAYNWPGNVRELIQALEKAVISAKDEPVLFPKHLPDHIRIHLVRASVLQKRAPAPGPETSRAAVNTSLSLKDFREAELARIEKEYLSSLLRRTNGEVGEACRISGLSRSRFSIRS
jgi:two-component system NtrC family response regulator